MFTGLVAAFSFFNCQRWELYTCRFSSARLYTSSRFSCNFFKNIHPLFIWHSPQLKQGDSCFNHYCIGWYHSISQCLTQCPQARLYCSRMPYGAVHMFYCFMFTMLTAFAILYSVCWYLRWYPYHALHGTLDTPIYGRKDSLPVDFYTRNRNTSDCLGTL